MVPEMDTGLTDPFLGTKARDFSSSGIRDLSLSSLVGGPFLYNWIVWQQMCCCCLKVVAFSCWTRINLGTSHLGLESWIIALDAYQEISNSRVFGGELVVNVLSTRLH